MIWTIDHTSPLPLRDQIVTIIRRALASGDLVVGEPLPPAAELAEDLAVDRNTVLTAYRQLRDDGILDFRRGRPVRIVHAPRTDATILDLVQTLISLGSQHGLDREALIHLIREAP
ncbi:MAG: GntR family transcriptional regulator [Thermomicrobiales bacterium]